MYTQNSFLKLLYFLTCNSDFSWCSWLAPTSFIWSRVAKATPKSSNAELSHLLWVLSGHLITVHFVKLISIDNSSVVSLNLNTIKKLAMAWDVLFRQAQCLYEKKLPVIRATLAVKKKHITFPSWLYHPSPTPLPPPPPISTGNTRLLLDFLNDQWSSRGELGRRAVSDTWDHINGMTVPSQLVVLLQNVLVLSLELTFVGTFCFVFSVGTFTSAMCTVYLL